jgi:hypothetical protein
MWWSEDMMDSLLMWYCMGEREREREEKNV